MALSDGRACKKYYFEGFREKLEAPTRSKIIVNN